MLVLIIQKYLFIVYQSFVQCNIIAFMNPFYLFAWVVTKTTKKQTNIKTEKEENL